MRSLFLAAAMIGLGACSAEPPAQLRADPKTGANHSASIEADETPAAADGGSEPADAPPSTREAIGAITEASGPTTDASSPSELDSELTIPGESAGETDAADPLEPELPAGPEPGSPEADAELLALLDESTLTQEEFERGFGKDGPTIDGDAFEFGPNARTRGQPEVRAGRIEGPAAAALEELVEREQSKLGSCLAMALTKDTGATGSLTLGVELDGQGAVTKVDASELRLGGADEIREALVTCLISVVEAWQLPDAKAGRADLPLSLSTKT